MSYVPYVFYVVKKKTTLMNVTIIGGGVIGLCAAYYLNKSGFDVTVIDQHEITDGCSFGNMGYISPSHFIPIATPGIISQGVKWMLRSSSPFYIKPRLNLDLLRWGVTFWKSATAKNVEDSAPHLNNLLQLSRQLMNDLKRDLPSSFDMIEKGCWMLYKNPATGEHEKQLADQAAKYGLRTITCSAAEVQDYEKNVEVDVAGGVLYLDDCHLNPAKFMKALYDYLQKAGVRFWLNSKVCGFETANDRISAVVTTEAKIPCGEVVISNGSWLSQTAKLLGIKILLQPGKGYSVVYEGLKKNLLYPSILVDHRTATAPNENPLRIGGTKELSGHSDTILPKRVWAIYNAFHKYYPSFQLPKPELSKTWFGYRPVSPDGLPYIGRTAGLSNMVIAGGHAMLGVSAAAGTGLLVDEIIRGKATSINISAFQPERFR